ncbi:hypothetical protein Ahy_A03g010967 [Arachis hypogaea]|uniref:Uncharacterized protein n=1 Tax=Arachis hypogaea TaxID=3818 RepID=A0A445DP46_ARAHY|nr:hypothetical protein Ahy_A03g010967 [Arachis hypogaea]
MKEAKDLCMQEPSKKFKKNMEQSRPRRRALTCPTNSHDCRQLELSRDGGPLDSGLSGGLCLFWKNNVNIHVYAWFDNFIKTKISSGNDKDWKATFVYGHLNHKRRKEL